MPIKGAMNLRRAAIMGMLCACRIYAQIIDGKKENKELVDEVGRHSRFTQSDALEEAVAKLSTSISVLGEKLGSLEENLRVRFGTLEEAITKEKVSVENLTSRLEVLDNLSVKVKELDMKMEGETTVIRRTLSVTNKDVQRLSTQLEELERRNSQQRLGDIKVQKKEAGLEKPAREAASAERNRPATHDREEEIGLVVLEKVERVLPRLIASQLNHFYLNMATKTDSAMSHLERELVSRLRRIEATVKKSLSEIQDGRQDLSHLSHLQRTVISKQIRTKGHGAPTTIAECEAGLRADLKELLQQVHENVSRSLVIATKTTNHNFKPDDRQHKDKGGIPQPSEIWRGVFSPALSRQSSIPIAMPGSTKHCLDPTAFATLEEVKQLLRSLMAKGEDLKKTLTKQAGEGVDLLKLLHQRFSVLLRRMNTDPGHGKALLAEVQELEHLVENSYSSILLAQNVFIESCRRVQAETPSIEGQIVDILNKLVTNIDLGHQFNRKQLKDLRKLIEKMRLEDQTKLPPLLPPWIESNETDVNIYHHNTSTPSADRLLYQTVLLSAAEVNSTEEKLQGVLQRIAVVENELQSISWNAEDVKNIIDELLTGAKDLKGYSRSQIDALQSFRADLLEFSDSLLLQMSQANLLEREHAKYGLTTEDREERRDSRNREDERHQKVLDSCFSFVLRELNTSAITKYVNNMSLNITNKELTIRILRLIIDNTTIITNKNNSSLLLTPPTQNTTSTSSTPTDSDLEDERYLQNVDQLYYDDLDEEEMLMDDDLSWSKINYYDDDHEYENAGERKKMPSSFYLSTFPLSKPEKAKNKVTVLEENVRND